MIERSLKVVQRHKPSFDGTRLREFGYTYLASALPYAEQKSAWVGLFLLMTVSVCQSKVATAIEVD
jgi:hypothetical protein